MKKTILILLTTSSLTLSGCTGLLVGGAVATVAGVISVAHDRRTAGTVIDDKNLEAKISKSISNNAYVDGYSHTNLTVFNGVVLVTGEVTSKDVENKVINIIKNTDNVKRVESDLKVMAKSTIYNRSRDAVITGKVKTALLGVKLPGFDTSLVNVSTERGHVYIMGVVSRTEGNAIGEKARIVSGVESVTKVFEYID